MKDLFSRIAFPIILIFAGVLLLIVGNNNDQNGVFMIACGAIAFAGVITLLNALEIISGTLKMVALLVLIVVTTGMSWLNYQSIKVPVDFLKEKEIRYEFVVQNLKDIREAEFAYKTAKGKYCNNFDTLLSFLKTDSLVVIKAIGTVPDSLTEEKALELGIISRDTAYAKVLETVFDASYLAEHHGDFIVDSLPLVPFTATPFKLEADIVDKNGVKVSVFQATDAAPFDKRDVLKVGSMTDPTTSGNWE